MATVLLPRSLLQLYPGVERRHDVDATDVAAVIDALDARVPGMRDRLVESGPRLRAHINVFVDGEPADLATPVGPATTVHVIPAVSGGCVGARSPRPSRRSSTRRPGRRSRGRRRTRPPSTRR